MPFADLREFIAAADRLGELRTVTNADWDLEIGAITEINYQRQGPALLLDEIKGYPRGYRILANAMDSLRRSLLALDLPLDASIDEALDLYQERIDAFRPTPPREVPHGPIHENVLSGDDIDLWKLPTPKWHEEDGGRYLGTGDMVIMRDPDTGRVHFGTYRVMVQDEKTAGLYISPIHTGAIIEKKYWARGQSCPVVVVFGEEPVLFCAGAGYLGQKRGLPKYELAGHVRGAPVEIVCEEITGLPIPAAAEIAIAGEVPPPSVEARPEGPFGEWTG
ncbi:MAG TPA: UbiD family decarboxylase, partial [Chloroflexota bacterium]|nr:UbiD family decarboxylase [Chloroflexota bacterium]